MGPAGALAGGAKAGHGDARQELMLGTPCRPEGCAARGASSNHLLSLLLSAGLPGGRGGRQRAAPGDGAGCGGRSSTPEGEGCSHSAGRPQGRLRVHSLPAEAAGGDRRLTAARRGRDGGRGPAAETGFSATARRLPDRTRRRGGLSAGSAKHRPGEGGERGRGKTFGLQGDAAAETSCPSAVRRVSRGGKKWERAGSALLTATVDSVGETGMVDPSSSTLCICIETGTM